MVVVCKTTQEALDLLRYCLEDGEVRPGAHFRKELANEKISFVDAWAVLRSGAIYEPPELDIKSGEWKWKVEGYEPGGAWLIIVFTFKTVDQAFLITVFSAKRGARR
jgi:hypothetical protein